MNLAIPSYDSVVVVLCIKFGSNTKLSAYMSSIALATTTTSCYQLKPYKQIFELTELFAVFAQNLNVFQCI